MRLVAAAPAATGEREEREPLAFADIFRSHAPYIWRLVRRLGATQADADDLCQEVFVVVHRRMGEIDTTRPLRPWIYGVAVRVAADHRRRSRNRQFDSSAVTAHAAHADLHDIGAPAEQHAAMEQRYLRDLLDEAIARLDEPKRAIFVLHELEELTVSEIAEALSCPLQTAYSRLHAARKEVKAFFARLEAKETAR